MEQSLDSRVDDNVLEEFIKVARAKGEVSSRIAAIGLWNSKSADDRTAYIDQNRNAVNLQKTQVTQDNLETYKTKVDSLYAKLSGLVLKNDQSAPTANELVGHLNISERAQYEGLRVVEKVAGLVGYTKTFSHAYVEKQRKNLTFRRIDEIVTEYRNAIDENASELQKARTKEHTLESDRNTLYEQLLKFGEEFESCEKYIINVKKQLDLARERQRKGEQQSVRDIGACQTRDLEPTQKRYDELAGKIKHTWVFLQYAKRNYASMRMAAHVLDQLDTRLRCDQEFLKDFRTRHTDIVDIEVPLRGLDLVRKYNGFGAGIAEFSNGQDSANVDLAKLDISPGHSFSTSDQAHCEEIANALETINGEVRNSVREIIDRARQEAYGL